MATNPYFNLTGIERPNQEQDLLHKLVTESIQIHGTDVWYIKRTAVKKDALFGEDILASFSEKYKIEMYMESIERYDGLGDVMEQFGAVVKDQVNLQVAQKRFIQVTGMKYPKEGDLIYFPFYNKPLWEIKFVEQENQFYPLGTLPSFRIRANLFDYAGENIDTGIPDIDSKIDEYVAPQTIEDLENVTDPDNVEIETEADTVVVPEDSVWGQF